MIRVLEPLARIAGVRLALLVAPDGVPVLVRGSSPAPAAAAKPGTGEPAGAASDSAESFAALATGWLDELARAVAPLSWHPPERVVLSSARGTLVLVPAPGAVLVVILDRGASPEDLRLPMEATIARLQRVMRSIQEAARPAPAEVPPAEVPPAPVAAIPVAAIPVAAIPVAVIPGSPSVKGSPGVSADSPSRHSPRDLPV